MSVKDKVYHPRFLTYWLIFPGDKDMGDYWIKQIPFIHSLQFEMQNWRGFNKDPKVVRDLFKKGETHWKDHNGVEHRLVIEDKKRPERWGIPKN